jgi:aminopeptidase N
VQLGEDGQAEQSFYFPLEREPALVRIDPDGWLLKTLKFERSNKMLRYQLAYDADILGRIEAAQELAKASDEVSLAALTAALNNDPFWAVRAAAAKALSTLGNEKAQLALIKALQELDPTRSSKVRNSVVRGLGVYKNPPQAELAQRSADALRALLTDGDSSYLVEASAAEALGKTGTEGNVDFLIKLLDRPSWTNFVQSGIFRGLGFTGVDSVIDTMATYARDEHNHPTLRRAALAGLVIAGQQRHLYGEQARERAVATLIDTVEHDTWSPARSTAARALGEFDAKRAIPVLTHLAENELDSGVQRLYLVVAQTLSTGDKEDEQLKQLRHDLDEVREENRKLREQLGAIEVRLK